MKVWGVAMAVIVAAMVLVGCGSAGETQAPADEGSSQEAGVETYASEILGTDYEGALAASAQLAFGTLRLAETGAALTPEQAQTLLPLWHALQGGVTAAAEVNAVLKQIEGAMTSEQLEAIAAMQLTQEGMRAWMEEHGVGFADGFAGGGGQREVSEEARATRQAQFENMSDEEREALRATRQAGGNPFGEGEGGPAGAGRPDGAREFGGARQYVVLLQPLIELLEELTAE